MQYPPMCSRRRFHFAEPSGNELAVWTDNGAKPMAQSNALLRTQGGLLFDAWACCVRNLLHVSEVVLTFPCVAGLLRYGDNRTPQSWLLLVIFYFSFSGFSSFRYLGVTPAGPLGPAKSGGKIH